MTIFKIFKYPLKISGEIQSVHIEGAIRALSIVRQDEEPIMYVLVDTEKKEFTKSSIFEVKIIGTGHEIESHSGTSEDFGSWEFMNTLGFVDDNLMFHFFVRRKFVEQDNKKMKDKEFRDEVEFHLWVLLKEGIIYTDKDNKYHLTDFGMRLEEEGRTTEYIESYKPKYEKMFRDYKGKGFPKVDIPR